MATVWLNKLIFVSRLTLRRRVLSRNRFLLLIIMKFGSLVRVGKRNLRPMDSDLPNLVEMAQKRRQSKRQDNVAVKSRDRSIHHLIG